MLTDLQIGYLAGILDGEGQISIVKNIRRDDKTRRRNYALRVEVRISQRRRILLEAIQGWIGEENASIGANGLAGQYFVLRFKAHWLREHLPLILPHLILKQRQTEIVIRFLGHRAHIGRKGVGAEEWAVRDTLHQEVKKINADRTNSLH